MHCVVSGCVIAYDTDHRFTPHRPLVDSDAETGSSRLEAEAAVRAEMK